MNVIETATIQCPYCWEMVDITVDCSVPTQEYVEDCEVCCQPIALLINTSEDNTPTIIAKRES